MDFSAALTAVSFVKDALQVAVGYKIESESNARVIEAQAQLDGVREKLLEAWDTTTRLVTENEDLRRQIRAHDDWEARLANYPLVETVGAAIVHEFTGTPRHYACPACVSKLREIQPLQGLRAAGLFICPGCKNQYRIGSPPPPSPRSARSSTYLDGG
jgi:hypothetical protein